MYKKITALAFLIGLYGVSYADIDIQFANVSRTGSTITLDVQVRDASGSFTLGGSAFGSASSFFISYTNKGTGSGEIVHNSFTPSTSGYTTSFSDLDYQTIHGAVRMNFQQDAGSFTVPTSFTTIATLTFTVGAGSTTAQSTTFGILANTTVYNSSDAVVADGDFTGTAVQTLPINLTEFNLSSESNKVVLKWTTQSETNNEDFEIQRSLDGKEFKNIGLIPGAGNSNSQMNYEFSDIDLTANYGVIYYRLKQIDFDGRFEYSPTRSLTIENKLSSKISWYPNPATNLITILSEQTQLVEIYDITGKLTYNTSTNLNNVIDLSDLNNGTYFLVIKNMNGEIVQQDKLFVQ